MLLLFSCSVVSGSLGPCRLQPTRLLCPWDFPGMNTGVGCHFFLQGIFPTKSLSVSHCSHLWRGQLGVPLNGLTSFGRYSCIWRWSVHGSWKTVNEVHFLSPIWQGDGALGHLLHRTDTGGLCQAFSCPENLSPLPNQGRQILIWSRPWKIEVKWKLLSRVLLFATSWTIQSMEFSRPEYWSG